MGPVVVTAISMLAFSMFIKLYITVTLVRMVGLRRGMFVVSASVPRVLVLPMFPPHHLERSRRDGGGEPCLQQVAGFVVGIMTLRRFQELVPRQRERGQAHDQVDVFAEAELGDVRK